VNTLTVIATESYEAFAENLQKEIEADTGIRFGIVEQHQFATIPVLKEDGTTRMLGFESPRRSSSIWSRKASSMPGAGSRIACDRR
jgi:restriction endonuclease